jgi:streptogramin lyase
MLKKSGIVKDYYVMKRVQKSMRSILKRYSIIVDVIAVISLLSITTWSIVMTHMEQHTTFAQLSRQESLNSSIEEGSVQEFPVPVGSRPHDVAPMQNGTLVWYTAQGSGELGLLDPNTGETRHIALGQDSAPHGVIVGPDGAPWITDGGLNAIVRVDPLTEEVRVYPLPPDSDYSNLNTATFDHNGTL